MTRTLRSLAATISGVLMLGSVLIMPLATQAAGLIPEPTGKCPEDYQSGSAANLSVPCKDGGERDFALDDIKSLLATIGNFMLGVSGAIVLSCFVLGGFFWIASAGNQKMVDKGKGLISGAVIGLIIMFSAYTLVLLAVRTLVGSDVYAPAATGPTAGTPKGPKPPNKSITKGTISKMPLMVTKTGLCEKLSGTPCQKVNSCATPYAITDACGTDNVSDGGQECCMPVKVPAQTSPCGKMGGTCQDSSTACNGPYVKGFCSGKAAIQCCFKVY